MPDFPKKDPSAFRMKSKSPMLAKLVGNQDRLPQELQAKIEAAPTRKYKSPAKMYGKSPAKNYKKGYYGA